MFLSTGKCEGIGECMEKCPTGAIRLIEGKPFSCITCGACADACPNRAIFKNKYGGFVVDRAKCNACGVCEMTCPVNNIKIEGDMVKGICSRCGICAENCPINARIDAYDIIEDRQLKFLESLNLTTQPTVKSKREVDKSIRINVVTDSDKCTTCGRCEYYCPTDAIIVDSDAGFCTECRVCEDVCPVDAITNNEIDPEKCTLCLKCVKECPNKAIYVENFQIKIREQDENQKGSIISCLNCGLCTDACGSGALKMVNGKIRYDPTLCEECEDMSCLDACPVGTLMESDEEERRIKGYCVSCGRCVKACDLNKARSFKTVTWEGSVSEDCISCGICAEVCPKDAITLKRGSISVDLEKCVLCEKCAIHCPQDAIPTTTMHKKSIKDGFVFIENKLCMNCKLCLNTCPEEAIFEDEKGRLIVDESKCMFCGACDNVCPARAVLFEREFEVAK